MYPTRRMLFVTAGNGWRFTPNQCDQLPPIEIFDFSLMHLGGKPSQFDVYFEVDGEREYIDENDLPAPLMEPASKMIRRARYTHGIIYDEADKEWAEALKNNREP